MFDHNVIAFGVIGEKEIPDVDVTRTLATLSFTILLHFNSTLIILIERGLVDRVSLCLHE